VAPAGDAAAPRCIFRFARAGRWHASKDAARADGVQQAPDLSALTSSPGIDETLRSAARMIAASPSDNIEAEFILGECPEVYFLGLDNELIAHAESYIGEECLYVGCALRRERVAAPNGGTRQWHCDVEDDRMFRVIVYLCDVDEDGGPFGYIPAALSEHARGSAGYRSGFLSNSAMARLVDEADWRFACGPWGKTIMFDGTRVFHRATPPRKRDRLSLTITYTTRHPLQLKAGTRFGLAARQRLLAMLQERHRHYVAALRRF
jgi:hypothetical protein